MEIKHQAWGYFCCYIEEFKVWNQETATLENPAPRRCRQEPQEFKVIVRHLSRNKTKTLQISIMQQTRNEEAGSSRATEIQTTPWHEEMLSRLTQLSSGLCFYLEKKWKEVQSLFSYTENFKPAWATWYPVSKRIEKRQKPMSDLNRISQTPLFLLLCPKGFQNLAFLPRPQKRSVLFLNNWEKWI